MRICRREFLLGLLVLSFCGCDRFAKPSQSSVSGISPDRPPPQKDPSHPTTKAERDPSVLLKQANLEITQGNDFAAIALLENVLRVDPKNDEALALLTQTAERFAMMNKRPASSPYYLKAADALQTRLDAKASLSDSERTQALVILYNAACTLAINGESAKAIATLQTAINQGFNEVKILDSDSELDALRNLPEFLKVKQQVETRLIASLLANQKRFPFRTKIPGLDGKLVEVGGPSGKVVLLNFWGTWSPPSRKEIPFLLEIDRRYRSLGVKVIGIAIEAGSGKTVKPALEAFLKTNSVSYPCLIGSEALTKEIADFQGFPTCLFLDSQGVVRLKLDGYQPLSTLQIAIDTLLAEGGAKSPSKTASQGR